MRLLRWLLLQKEVRVRVVSGDRSGRDGFEPVGVNHRLDVIPFGPRWHESGWRRARHHSLTESGGPSFDDIERALEDAREEGVG